MFLSVSFLMYSCCSLPSKERTKRETESDPISTKEVKQQRKSDFDKLFVLLTDEGNTKGPFKKNPFIKDQEFVSEGKRIEISSYNAKYKIISEDGSKQVGQYDGITDKVTEYIKTLAAIEEADTMIESTQQFSLVAVGGNQKRDAQVHIDNYPLLGDYDHTPRMKNADAQRLEALILNVTELNELYNLDGSSGTSGVFTPSVGMRFSKGQDVLIAFGIPTVMFYKNGEPYRGIKMNPSSEEFAELKKIIKTYYPTINF
ncbi:hypothetical protein [uncultured Dokdonia sp.]|uniref:hypothetical protein n=1 Tax=uncultured Dokdonia sp. TaxID=575653 RepID=UPI00260B4F1C|nr:hypothetical protein [uncultured Dokdonia sp.]